jgi:hypothetical protein
LHIKFKKNITNLHDKNWDNISKFFFRMLSMQYGTICT